MKKLLSAVCSLAVVQMAHADVWQGNSNAMGGAGYISGKYSESVLLNPSMLAVNAPEKGGLGIKLGFGVLASDPDDLVSQAEDLRDLADEIRNSSVMSSAQGSELKQKLSGINEDTLFFDVGAHLAVSIAAKQNISLAFIFKTNSQVALAPNVASSDMALIDSYVGKAFDPESEAKGLKSAMTGTGAVVTEVGISLARSFKIDDKNRWLLGVTPKMQQLDTILYAQNVSGFEDDSWDDDQYHKSSKTANVDIGATYIRDKYRLGLVATNLKDARFDTINPAKTIEIKKQLTASGAYVADWFKAEVAADLNAVPSITNSGDVQFLRGGVEFNLGRVVQLRGGIKKDLKNTQADTLTAGVSFLMFDLAVMTGDKTTQGAALTFGLSF